MDLAPLLALGEDFGEDVRPQTFDSCCRNYLHKNPKRFGKYCLHKARHSDTSLQYHPLLGQPPQKQKISNFTENKKKF